MYLMTDREWINEGGDLGNKEEKRGESVTYLIDTKILPRISLIQ